MIIFESFAQTMICPFKLISIHYTSVPKIVEEHIFEIYKGDSLNSDLTFDF